MSDTSTYPARPVSVITTLFILVLFTLFYFLVRHYYRPSSAAPENTVAENLSKDLEWKATPASRRAMLSDLREKQAAAAATYGWVDQKAGVVRLPIQRAMELTAQQYGARK